MNNKRKTGTLLTAILAIVMLCSLALASCSKQEKPATVTFMVNDTVYKTVTAEDGAVALPENPEVEGYEFKGWFTDTGFKTQFTGKDIKESLTVYAKLEKNGSNPTEEKYKVTFLDGEGKVFEEVIADGTGAVALPGTNPEKADHRFVAWFKDADCTVAFDGTGVAADMNVYPKFEKVNFTVTFKTKNAEGAWIDYQTLKSDAAVVVLPEAPRAEEHFAFVGWFTDEAGTKAFNPTEVKADTLVYAKFQKINPSEDKFTVVYKTFDGEKWMTYETVVSNGTVVRLPAVSPKKEAYAFEGWYLDRDFKQAFNPAEVTADIEVYAHMVKVQFEVNFVIRQDGTGEWVNHRVIVTGNDGVIAKMPVDPAARGFDFGGWFTDEACTKAFDPLTKFEKDGVTIYGKLAEKVTGDEKNNYYAKIDGGEYFLNLLDRREVRFNADKEYTGTYNLVGDEMTIILDSAETVNATYQNGVITFGFKGKDLTFYVDAEYQVTFDSRSGSKVDPMTVRNGSLIAQPVSPTLKGYDFAGWYTDSECKNVFNFGEDRILGNTTLYAKWKKSAYIITYVTDETITTVNKTANVFNGEAYSLEVPTVKDANSRFAGWATEDGILLTDSKGNSLKVWDETLGNIKVVAKTEQKLSFELLPDGTYKAYGSEELKAVEQIVIPAYHEGKAVTAVGVFTGYDRVTSVTIPATAVSIDSMAFADCKALASFAVAPVNGVESKYTASADGVLFSDGETVLVFFPVASTIENYTVPATVTKIAPNAFRDFVIESSPSSLTTVGTLKTVVLPKDLETVGEYAFYARRNLTGLTFAKDAVAPLRIEDGAFKYCCASNVDMPQNLKYVGKQAFLGHSLTIHFNFTGCEGFMGGDMALPDGLEYIGDEGFKLCSFATVTVPDSVTFIGDKALQKSGWMGGEITFVDPANSKLKVLGKGAFFKATNSTVVLPAGLEVIEDGAFEQSSIATLVVPDGTVTIKDGAFKNMGSLTSVEIPASVTSFGKEVFAGCSRLKTTGIRFAEGSNIAVTGQDGVIYSADMTSILIFNSDLTEYAVPEGVKSLPAQVFKGLTNLTKVVLPGTLEEIGAEAFLNCGVTELVIPASCEIIGNRAFALDYGKTQILTKITFAQTAANGLIIENNAFEGLDLAIALPAGTTSIGIEAFTGCKFQNIVLPDSITTIGSKAFSNCKNLVSVTLPASLNSLASDAFEEATALQSFTVSDTAVNYKTVDGILYNSDMTTLVKYPYAKAGDSFTIPNTVVTVGAGAFKRNKTLTTIVFTENIREIGDSAFIGTNLTEVDLSMVNTIGKNAFSLCSNLTRVTIGKSLYTIPSGAFSMSGLSEIVGIEYIRTVGDFAFKNTNLSGVLDLSNVTSVGKYAFGQTSITGVIFSDKLLTLAEGSFYDTRIASITLPGSLKIFTGKIFEDVDTNVLVNNYKDTVLKEIILSEGIVSVEDGAFFDLTALEKVVIPASVTSIHANAFFNANNIREFVVADGNKNYKAVNGSLYTVDGTLVKYAGDGQNLVLGDNASGIGETALQDGTVIDWNKDVHSLKKFAAITVDSQAIVDGNVLGANGLASLVAANGSIRFKDTLDLSAIEAELLKTFDKTAADGYVVFSVKAAA